MSYPHTPYPAQAAYGFARAPPVSPSPNAQQQQQYYTGGPRYSVFAATPSPRGSPKVHARRASTFEPSAYANAQTYSARIPPQHTGGPLPGRTYASHQSTPLRNPEYVSGFGYAQGETRGGRPRAHSSTKRSRKQSYSYERDKDSRHFDRQYYYSVFVDEDGYYQYYYDAPPPYEKIPTYTYSYGAGTDPRFYYDQVPQYTETDRVREQAPPTPKANQARARRASHANPGRPHPTPPKTSTKPPPSPKASSRKATEADARKAGIPAGYSYKNWDPNEEPITLLGSVFDANSLGKWIYDWTVYYYGPATPMSDVAGDLWLLLIQLAGKVKRADEAIELIRQEESRELVEDFLESGERLWVRFKKLLKVCEEYMWKAAQRETGDKRPHHMGRNSGCEFVDSIFGRDRELDKTEKLMSAIRLWSMRFDANCDEILRNPAA
jgi:hypothetical protein